MNHRLHDVYRIYRAMLWVKNNFIANLFILDLLLCPKRILILSYIPLSYIF